MRKKSNRLLLVVISLLVYLTMGGPLPPLAPVQAETNGFAAFQAFGMFISEPNRTTALDIPLGSVGDSLPDRTLALSSADFASLQSSFPEPIKSKYP
jgi:hypothetical protein